MAAMLGNLPPIHKSQFGQSSCQIDWFSCPGGAGQPEIATYQAAEKAISR
jgi:hypothetical protein